MDAGENLSGRYKYAVIPRLVLLLVPPAVLTRLWYDTGDVRQAIRYR
jgi:hypothetical protein